MNTVKPNKQPRSFRYVDFPLDKNTELHLYVERDGQYISYCQSTILSNSDQVCEVTESEIKQFMDSNEYTVCSDCSSHL